MRINICRLPYNALVGISKSRYPLWAGYLYSNAKGMSRDMRLVDGETIDFGLHNSFFRKRDFLVRAGSILYPRYYYNSRTYFDVLDNEDHPVWDYYSEEVTRNEPDILAFSAYSNNFKAMMFAAKKIKKMRPNIVILLGGIHSTAASEETAKYMPEIDYLCIGEGEKTFDEFLVALEAGGSPDEVPGIYNPRDPSAFTPRALIDNLDCLEFPERNLAPQHLYVPEYRIFTSRGCPYNCSFCSSKRMWTRKVRFHSKDNVLAQLTELVEKHKAFRIIFSDDTFTVNKRRVREMANEIIKKGLDDLHYHIGARIENLDEDTLEILAASGVKSISFGIESGSPDIQEQINKRYDNDRVVSIIRAANRFGIRTLSYYMVGHPGESEADIGMSKRLIIDSQTTKVYLNAVQPLPGTRLYEKASKKGFQFNPENTSKMDFYAYPTVNLTKMDIQALERQIDDFSRFVTRYSFRGKIVQAIEYAALLLKRRLKRKFGLR